jgi:hypothetical protein
MPLSRSGESGCHAKDDPLTHATSRSHLQQQQQQQQQRQQQPQ